MKRMLIGLGCFLLSVILAIPVYADKVLAEIEYFYSDDGTLIGKAFNGKRVNFEYDLRGQLLAVKDASGKDLERYTYDPAGNRLSKTINGVTTAYTYDKANQLVTSTVNGVTTHYKYDAAGRMIQAGDKKYIYNGNNKVVAIWQNGDIIAKFEYNIDGQIAKAIYGDKVEEFMWDGLALIWRSGVTYINEPYVTGGNPVMAGDDVLFNDMLGSTLAVNGNPVEMTSFGETGNKNAFFTGKPMIDELGYSFLFRDYNPNQGKWTTSDPLGYPDGWNNLAYVNNQPYYDIDFLGAWTLVADTGMPPMPSAVTSPTKWTQGESYSGYGVYSITTYSWVQIATNGGTNGQVLLTTANAKTTSTSTISQYSASLAQTITSTANANGSFPGIAEFSVGISSSISGTISAGYSLQSGTSETVSISLGYSATADQNTYIEIYAYQLVATTTYYARYMAPSGASDPAPPIQELGALRSFTANLSHYGSSQKTYKE